MSQEYDPNHVNEYMKDMVQNGKTIAQKADELGVPRSTLYSQMQRARKRVETRKKPGPKITVVDMSPSKMVDKKYSIPELLAGIDFNVNEIKKILGVK